MDRLEGKEGEEVADEDEDDGNDEDDDDKKIFVLFRFKVSI